MRRRSRILIVAHSPLRGGAEYCLDTTLRNMDRERFDATVVFPTAGPMSDAARTYGYDVRIAPLCYCLNFGKNAWYWKNLLGRSWANVLRLRRIVRETRAELVYTNCASIFESALAARLADVPHVWHVHEVLANGNHMHQLLPLPVMKQLIYRLSTRIVFESHAARRVFEQSTPSDKSEVVYNSLRLTDDPPHLTSPRTRGNDRPRFGFAPEDRVLGFVGQFIDRKNPLLLLRALAKVRGVPNLKCLFAGEGALEGTMREEFGRLGLSGVCLIVGFQADVTPVMRAIDALVLPSRQESFGLVLVEAASHAKPAIACRCEGPSEIVVDGDTGFLVPQDDEDALARAIERMFAEDGDRRRMGEAARRRAKELFCPVKNTRKLEQVWLKVIEESRRNPESKERRTQGNPKSNPGAPGQNLKSADGLGIPARRDSDEKSHGTGAVPSTLAQQEGCEVDRCCG